ncbi:MAG: DoxX family protein [Candidatus Omnitrophica bacterium]|nr:DoxX family protein [Candidatus Omnitrophota bacterium]
MNDLAILVLRLALGIIFLAHGGQAAFGLFGGPQIGGFSQMLAGLGFRPPMLWAYIGAYTELIGGACLIFGLLTRVAALFLLVFIVVAALKVHLAKGFFLQNGGFEYNFLIACVCLVLVITGPGKFSLMNKF